MEIHQLEYVIEVANQKSFSKAAREICVAQSSLSQQISKLENELGLKIFERTTRTVHPTVAGIEFITYAKKILGEIENVKHCIQSHVGFAKGTVNIGAITTLESIGFIPLITSFNNMYPGLNLNIFNSSSPHLAELLLASEIDVAIFTPLLGAKIDGLDFYPLTEDEFVLITSINHPLAKRGIIDLAEAAKENFIFPSPDQSTHSIHLLACGNAGFLPKIVCKSSHAESNLALVSAGMGISFFPLATIEACNHPGIAIVRLSQPIKRHIIMALRNNSYYSPPLIAFCNYLLKKTGSEIIIN